jgi:hypothetical protein
MMGESAFFTPDSLGEDLSDQPVERGAVLLDSFRSLRFEYMMHDGVDTEWRPQWDAHEEEALPAAVRIIVEGLAGLEVEAWGQEIPVMVAHYGDSLGELDEDLLSVLSEEDVAQAGEDGDDNEPDDEPDDEPEDDD